MPTTQTYMGYPVTNGEIFHDAPFDYHTTPTSVPTADEVAAMERYLGYPLPEGAASIRGDSKEAYMARQYLLHPLLFRLLANDDER